LKTRAMKGTAILLLATALVGSLAVGRPSDSISNGYYSGRSADIIVSSDLEQSDEYSAFFPSNRFIQSWPVKVELEDQSFADLVSAVMGGPVINDKANRNNFPTLDIFNKANTNALFFIDGISNVEAKQLSFTKKDGSFFEIQKTAYPQDVVSTAATLSTGHTSKFHGIVGADWHTKNGIRSAYKSGALPQISSLSDVFAQNLKEDFSVLSASMDFQLASAFGVHPYIYSNSLSNHASLSFDHESGAFSDIHNEITPFHLSKSGILSSMVLREFSVETSLDLTSMKYTVDGVDFYLNNPDHFNFFAELEAITHSVEKHIQLTQAKTNMYNLAFSSLKSLKKVSSKDQVRVALVLLDQVVSDLMEKLNKAYGEKLSIECVFVGASGVDSIKKDHEATLMAYLAVNHIVSSKSTFEHYFPQIYVQDQSKLNQETCNNLDRRLFDHYHVACPGVDNKMKRAVHEAATSEDDDFAVFFHILLWFNIILFFTAFFAVYALFNMDTGSDSLLYRMTSVARR